MDGIQQKPRRDHVMRTAEATIRAAILHLVKEIRSKALDFFGR
jgi:hypothetical protein